MVTQEIHLEPWYLRRYMWAAKGMYSSIISRSATAIPVRIRLIGFRLMSLPQTIQINLSRTSSTDYDPTKGDKEPVCEDKDVDDVEDDADDADGQGEVAMHRLIQLLHRFSSLISSNPRFV